MTDRPDPALPSPASAEPDPLRPSSPVRRQARRVARAGISLIWAVPALALVVTLALAWNAYTGRGVLVPFTDPPAIAAAVVGLLAGVLAWRWFRRIGWPVVPLALLAATLAGLLCWWVGTSLDPDDFASRIATAHPGDDVPVDFRLRSLPALLVWPFFATIPVLLGSSLGRDEDDPAQRTAPQGERPQRPIEP